MAKYSPYNHQLSPGSIFGLRTAPIKELTSNSNLAERTTLEPVSHELGAQYGFTPSNITELGTDMTPTSMSQLRNVFLLLVQ